MNKNIVSVIVPTYNVERYLPKCLDSLISQDFNSYEIICIDDCSTDNSFEIASQYEISYPDLLRVIKTETNLGQGSARIQGVDLATGKYIAFVDSDDYIAPDYLTTLVNAAEQSKSDIIVSGFTRDINGKLSRNFAPEHPWCLATYAIACAKLFKTEFLRDNNIHFSKERRGEDIYFNLACLCSNASCNVIQYSGYFYRANAASTTKTISHTMHFEQSIISMFNELNATYTFSNLATYTCDIICYSFFANSINALITYAHGCGIKEMSRRYSNVYSTARTLFPFYENNPLFSLKATKGQTGKIKWSVWMTMVLHRLGRLDRFLFYLISLV